MQTVDPTPNLSRITYSLAAAAMLAFFGINAVFFSGPDSAPFDTLFLGMTAVVFRWPSLLSQLPGMPSLMRKAERESSVAMLAVMIAPAVGVSVLNALYRPGTLPDAMERMLLVVFLVAFAYLFACKFVFFTRRQVRWTPDRADAMARVVDSVRTRHGAQLHIALLVVGAVIAAYGAR